jgi:hypothetical protein
MLKAADLDAAGVPAATAEGTGTDYNVMMHSHLRLSLADVYYEVWIFTRLCSWS